MAFDAGKLRQESRHPLSILIALADMQKHMFALSTGFKTENFVNLKVLRLAAIDCATKRVRKQMRQTLEIEIWRGRRGNRD